MELTNKFAAVVIASPLQGFRYIYGWKQIERVSLISSEIEFRPSNYENSTFLSGEAKFGGVLLAAPKGDDNRVNAAPPIEYPGVLRLTFDGVVHSKVDAEGKLVGLSLPGDRPNLTMEFVSLNGKTKEQLIEESGNHSIIMPGIYASPWRASSPSQNLLPLLKRKYLGTQTPYKDD